MRFVYSCSAGSCDVLDLFVVDGEKISANLGVRNGLVYLLDVGFQISSTCRIQSFLDH